MVPHLRGSLCSTAAVSTLQTTSSCRLLNGFPAFAAPFHFDRFGFDATNDKQLSFA